jgi:uncharacterized protein (DUF2236 family)
MTVSSELTATDVTSRVAAAFTAGVSRAPGDDGLFGPCSVTWRVARDPAYLLGGLRSLLLQALHPLAMAGVDQHSQWRQDPFGRLARTVTFMTAVTFGDRAGAEKAVARLGRVHGKVHGVDPVTGLHYAADDPMLLLWVHAVFVDSALAAVDAVGRGLLPAERDQYVTEMGILATLLGIPANAIPTNVAALDDYLAVVRPQLQCTPAAREFLAYLLLPPDLDAEMAEIWADLCDGVMATLPRWATAAYGYGSPPMTTARRDEIRQVLGLLDSMLVGEPGVLEARQAIALRARRARG